MENPARILKESGNQKSKKNAHAKTKMQVMFHA